MSRKLIINLLSIDAPMFLLVDEFYSTFAGIFQKINSSFLTFAKISLEYTL